MTRRQIVLHPHTLPILLPQLHPPNGVLSMALVIILLMNALKCFVLNSVKTLPGLTSRRGKIRAQFKTPQINSCHPFPTAAHPFSIPSLVPACSSTPVLTVKIMLENVSISLGVDTGASVTLLCQSAYSALEAKFPNFPLQLQKSNVTLSSVQGSILHAAGTVTLPISLAPNSDIFNI